MQEIYNGMPAGDLGTTGWRRPWSGANGDSCVEVMVLSDGRIAMRKSTDPNGPALIYSLHEISTFVHAAKRGHADFLLTPPADVSAAPSR